jgi:hypothetical protein
MNDTPIEDGWQELLTEMPEMTPETVALLRSVFFAGARHYRNIVRSLFNEDTTNQFETLVTLAKEIDQWAWSDTSLETMRMAKR